MITDEMVETFARHLAKPGDDDLWHWGRYKKSETEYVEAHWRDYVDDAREYIQLVAPLIAAQECEECARIADAIAAENLGNPGEIWAEQVAVAIRARKIWAIKHGIFISSAERL